MSNTSDNKFMKVAISLVRSRILDELIIEYGGTATLEGVQNDLIQSLNNLRKK